MKFKYALVNDIKSEPSPGLKGFCQSCGSTMIAKCGPIRVPHWAHSKCEGCDPWWENETIWHREWKDQFPIVWQEVRSEDTDGVVHIADIARPDGFFIEFQFSSISKEEVESRNIHYKNLVWVANGTKSKIDIGKLEYISEYTSKHGGVVVTNLKLKIVKKWMGLAKHIFIDFEDTNTNGERRIFYLCDNRYHQFLIEILVKDFVSFAKVRGGMKPFIENTRKLKEKLVEIKTEPFRKRLEWEKKNIDPFRKKYE